MEQGYITGQCVLRWYPCCSCAAFPLPFRSSLVERCLSIVHRRALGVKSDWLLGGADMRKALPVISQDAKTLKRCLQCEHDGRKQARLQLLYLLASKRRLLGIHRIIVAH